MPHSSPLPACDSFNIGKRSFVNHDIKTLSVCVVSFHQTKQVFIWCKNTSGFICIYYEITSDTLISVGTSCRTTPIGVADHANFPDHRMTATSFYDERFAPYNGRLYGEDCWQPRTPGTYDYLQLDLGAEYFICAIATQGNGRSNLREWTTQYKIVTSSDNFMSNAYEEDGSFRASGSFLLGHPCE